MNKIFGHDWEDIRDMQQKNYVPRTVDVSKDARPGPTESDHYLLAQHGVDGLKEMGYFGVLDRLNIK
jgi:hypothetical protein